MSKYRAWTLTVIIMTLMGVVIWLMWDYALRSFWVIALMFAFYGFFCCAVNLGHFLQAESWFPQRPRRGAHSMEEADAALWERVAPSVAFGDSSPRGGAKEREDAFGDSSPGGGAKEGEVAFGDSSPRGGQGEDGLPRAASGPRNDRGGK